MKHDISAIAEVPSALSIFKVREEQEDRIKTGRGQIAQLKCRYWLSPDFCCTGTGRGAQSSHYFFSDCKKFQRSLITCKKTNGGREKEREEGEKDELVKLEQSFSDVATHLDA